LVSPEGTWMQDTSEIIDALERRFPEAPVLPTSPVQRFAARLFELWGDEFWLPTAMHMRWSHPAENYPLFAKEASKSFFPGWPQWLSGFIVKHGLARMLHGFLPVLGVTPKTAPLLDTWTDLQLDALDCHFAVHPYLFGSCMSLGDLGLIGPLYAHLGRDPWPKRHLIEPRKNLHAWVQRMMKPQAKTGAFLPDDQMTR
jgi:glutathione S-transferase